jgi:hypothetical protein
LIVCLSNTVCFVKLGNQLELQLIKLLMKITGK